MSCPYLLARLALRELSARWGRNLTNLLGIGFGVALIVAVWIGARSTALAFQAMLEALSGEAALEVTGGGAGLPEELVEKLRAVPGVLAAAPLVLGSVFLDDDSGLAISVVGVDAVEESKVRTYEAEGPNGEFVDPLEFLNSRQSILLTEAFLRRCGKRVGDTLTVVAPVGRRDLVVRGALRPRGIARAVGEHLGVMDLFAAEALLGKDRTVDRVSLTVAEGHDVEEVSRLLTALLPSSATVDRPEHRGAEVDRMLAGFRNTVVTLSTFALLVGICLVYSTLSTAVLRRQRELGVLRSAGARRRDVLSLVLLEAAMLGIAGSGLGAFLGAALSRVLVGPLAEAAEVQSLLPLAGLPLGAPQTRDFVVALSGLGATLLAGWVPARRAGDVSPMTGLQAGSAERMAASDSARSGWLAAAFLPIGGALIALGIAVGVPVFVGTGTMLGVAATILMAAVLTTHWLPRSGRLLRAWFGVTGKLVAGRPAQQPPRTAYTAALVTAGSMLFVFVAVVNQSIKGSFLDEVRQTFKADLMVSSAVLTGGRLTAPVDARVGDALAAAEGVLDVVSERRVYARYHGVRAAIVSYSDSYFTDARHGTEIFVAGDASQGLRAVAAGEAALVSDNFAYRHGVRVDDILTLDTPREQATFRVAGVVVDNFDADGTVVLSRSAYQRWWPDPMANWFRVLVRPGVDVERVRRDIERHSRDGFRLVVQTRPEVLGYVEDTIDAAFRFALGLEVVVALIVLLSLAEALIASALARTRELGVLRAVGARRRDVMRMVLLEGVVVSAVGSLMGLVAGLALAALWMHVHLKYVFGWLMSLHLPVLALPSTLVFAMTSAAVAALYPAWQASRLPVVRSLTYE